MVYYGTKAELRAARDDLSFPLLILSQTLVTGGGSGVILLFIFKFIYFLNQVGNELINRLNTERPTFFFFV